MNSHSSNSHYHSVAGGSRGVANNYTSNVQAAAAASALNSSSVVSTTPTPPPLSSSNGRPFLRNSSNMFCHLCLQSIPASGGGNFTVSFDQFYYHRECFRCIKCDRYLSESDAYVTNETNKLLNCINCSIKRKSTTASANIQSMIASINNNSNASNSNNNNGGCAASAPTPSSFQHQQQTNTPPHLHQHQQQLASKQFTPQTALTSNSTTTTTATTPQCTPSLTNTTLNDLKSRFETNPAIVTTRNGGINNTPRLIQSNFSTMSINDQQQALMTTPSYQTPTIINGCYSASSSSSSAALSSASTLTLCNSNSSVVARPSYFNNNNRDHYQPKQHNTPNSIFSLNVESSSPSDLLNMNGDSTTTTTTVASLTNNTSRLSVNLRRSGETAATAHSRLSSSPSTTATTNTTTQQHHQARRSVASPVSSPTRPTSNQNDGQRQNEKQANCSTNSNNMTTTGSSSNWVNVRTHTAKCNIMLRKKRRGNKRSKSLPARFNIDSLLEYFNYSMLLNKYELKKLHQLHNAYYLNISSNRSTTQVSTTTAIASHGRHAAIIPSTAHSTLLSTTTTGGGTTVKLNRVPSNLSTMPFRLNSTVAPVTQHHHHHHHQLSSGYNSENHSNSSNSTSTTTIYAPAAGTSTAASHQSHLLNQQNVLNFYRLSLNHLPLNFTNTQCTCGGNAAGSKNNSTNGKKQPSATASAGDFLSKSALANAHNISLKSDKCGAPTLSSSPNNGNIMPHHVHGGDDDEEEEDAFSEDDDDLDEDLDMEEDEEEEEEDEEMVIEDENAIVKTNGDGGCGGDFKKLDSTKLSNSSLNRVAAAAQNDKFYFNTVTRAHGTSSCPHTAKVDMRRVRSFADLTHKQAIYNEEDFEFKEKLGEGFFANVKKCVWKRTGAEMVLKELKLNCVNLKKRGEEESGGGVAAAAANTGGSLDSCDSYELQQPRIDLMINYAELNAAHKSFLKEAQVLRNLNHPNVIKFMGVMFAKERQFNLILEYIGGGTLKDIIHNIAVPLPWKLRVGYAKDIAAAMQYLHSLNIIHRDLKSDNCLVRENGRTVVVADFGLSRINNSSFFSGTCAMSSRSRRDNTTSLLFQDLNDSSSSTLLKFQNLLGQQQQQQQQNQGQLNHHHQSPGSSNHSSSATNSFIVAAKRKLKRRGGYSNMNQQNRLRQRYAVVGNSFSMAPEMLKHQIYDERVDIFSFGIICCEIIGRVQADPDYLPRTSDFGLNVELFRKKYCEADCPKHFVRIAIACCELEPEKRPPFSKTHLWLETILSHLEANNPIPKNLLKNILDSNTKRPTSSTFSNNNGAATLPNLVGGPTAAATANQQQLNNLICVTPSSTSISNNKP